MAQIFIPGTADPSSVLEGKTFSAGSKYQATGSMPNRGSFSVTPGRDTQWLPWGFYNGNGYVLGDANLIASNIRRGLSIFGVNGSLIEGAPWSGGVGASTTTTSTFYLDSGSTTSRYSMTVTGLSYTPKVIVAYYFHNSGYGVPACFYNSDAWAGNSGYSVMGLGNGQVIRVGQGAAAVTSNGFTIPIAVSDVLIYWNAFADV